MNEYPVKEVHVAYPLHSDVHVISVTRTNLDRHMLSVWYDHKFEEFFGTEEEVWNEYHRRLSEG